MATQRRKTLAQLSKETGKSKSTIQRYLRAGWNGNPATIGRYGMAKRRAAAKPRTVPRADRPLRVPDRDGRDWGVEYRKAKAKLAELDLAERRGELIRVVDHQAMLLARIAEVRSALLALPRGVAPRLRMREAAEIEVELHAEVIRILERFARPSTVVPRDVGTPTQERGKHGPEL